MNMQIASTSGSRPMVSIAQAAAALTAAGDRITPSNVSRYVERFKEAIPSRKEGRVRLVDFVALAEHRNTNVRVSDKQFARGVEVAPPPILPALEIAPPLPVQATAGSAEGAIDPEEGTLNDIQRALKILELRKRQREEDLADGQVVPSKEVLELLSVLAMTIFTGWEQQEPLYAQRFGRDAAAAFRKTRKDVQASTSRTLLDIVRRHLPANLTGSAVDAAGLSEADPAPTNEAAA